MGALAKSGAPPWVPKALKRLTRLASRLGVTVDYMELEGPLGVFVPDDMEIYIDTKVMGKDRVNYLLHELGHASIHLDGLTRKRFNVFDEDAKTPRDRLTLVEEEFEAWHRGKLIAQTTGIVLDESFELARERSLMTYMRWCASDGYATSGGTLCNGRTEDHNDTHKGIDEETPRQLVTEDPSAESMDIDTHRHDGILGMD